MTVLQTWIKLVVLLSINEAIYLRALKLLVMIRIATSLISSLLSPIASPIASPLLSYASFFPSVMT
jgi:hypothetical protein